MKTLLVYYSLSGNTKAIAEEIAQELQIDSMEIKTKWGYPKARALQVVVGGGQVTFKMKPSIGYDKTKWSQYDQIILGFPVWAGNVTPAIRTLLHEQKDHKKVVACFTTSGTGDNASALDALKKVLPSVKVSASFVNAQSSEVKSNPDKVKAFVNAVQPYLAK
ncbi:MAG: flavodoxin family protein [Erysipelotrichaceae bacterium]